MDAQLKRGFLEACALASIREEASYGYKIIKEVPDILELTESTLYPLLKRLEMADYLTVQSAEHNGRLRKYYQITPKGLERIDEFLAEWDEIDEIYRYVRGGSSE